MKINEQMFRTFPRTSVLSFLTGFKLAQYSNGLPEGSAMWLPQLFKVLPHKGCFDWNPINRRVWGEVHFCHTVTRLLSARVVRNKKCNCFGQELAWFGSDNCILANICSVKYADALREMAPCYETVQEKYKFKVVSLMNYQNPDFVS